MQKNKLAHIAKVTGLVLLLSVPQVALAQLNTNNFQCQGTGLNCTGGSVNDFIRVVINWILGITFGVAVLFLIIGGFMYITSGASPANAEKGKKTVINAIIGIVIIILSYVIVNVVANLVSSNRTP